MEKFVLRSGIFFILILLLFNCDKKNNSKNRGFSEMQKRVIDEDDQDVKDGKSAIVFFSNKCNTDFNKPFYLKSEGELKYFDCSTTPLSDRELKYLVFSPELTGIHVTGKDITDRVFEYFKDFKDIESITMYNTSVTGKNFNLINSFVKLIIVDFKGSPITDEGCRYLSEIELENPINEADFSSTKITDEGLKYLSKIKFNGELRFKNTKITDAGLKYLANQTELWELYLNNTLVTEKGIKWLESQLPDLDIYLEDKDI
jgi:hypothetical protein